jgi:beta-N-acetylhexosaminidase
MSYTLYTFSKKRRSLSFSLSLLCCLVVLISSCASSATPSVSSDGHANASSVSTSIPTATSDVTALALQKAQDRVQTLLKGMSIDDKLAQMIMVEFIGSDYAGSGLQQMVMQQHVGGFLYQEVNHNFTAPNDSISATKAFSEQAIAESKITPLIAIDQEGGLVSKTEEFFGPTPSAQELTASKDVHKAKQQGETAAAQLKQLGMNVDLAPVVDVGPATGLLQSRMYGDDPTTVSTYAGAFLDGLQQEGIIGTLKHFPGLGSLGANDDPHDSLPHVTRSLSDLENIDFAPYRTLLQKSHPAMVMTTDVVTEALDNKNAAELSPKVLRYLRNTLHFDGVVITDGLYMRGLYNGQDPTPDQLAQVSVQAVQAGNDMIEGPYTVDEVSSIISALKQAIQNGSLSETQVDQSVTRLLLMKLQYGLIKL